MAAPHHIHNAVSQDTLITIKVSVNESVKKLKLSLRDLGANSLPDKVCEVTVYGAGQRRRRRHLCSVILDPPDGANDGM